MKLTFLPKLMMKIPAIDAVYVGEVSYQGRGHPRFKDVQQSLPVQKEGDDGPRILFRIFRAESTSQNHRATQTTAAKSNT
jgi:hypothetical protein